MKKLAYLVALSMMRVASIGAQSPVVFEHYDEITVICEEDNDHYEAVFIRNARVIATRRFNPERCEWLWTGDKNGFRLIWDDWSGCHRVIDFDRLSVWRVEKRDNDFLPWWDQRRLATDLKQP